MLPCCSGQALLRFQLVLQHLLLLALGLRVRLMCMLSLYRTKQGMHVDAGKHWIVCMASSHLCTYRYPR
jgi:hypothetical protein